MSDFERTVLVHLDAAYNLALWLTRDAHGAEDAVQDACVRACRFHASQQGPNAKAWFMAIVRNACLDWLKERSRGAHDPYDEDTHGVYRGLSETLEGPEAALARSSEARWVRECIAALPREYREVIVLRELEELSYKEISAIVDVPVGTVMSRLARGRDLLQQRLARDRRSMPS